MVYPDNKNINNLEKGKFEEGSDGKSIVKTILKGGLAIPYNDGGSVAYPDSVTEIYTFTNNSTTVMTITLTYTDDSKESLSTWAVV